MSRLPLLLSEPAKQPWFWQTALLLLAIVLLANLLLIVLVYGRRARELLRAGRTRSFRARFRPIVDSIARGETLGSPAELRYEIGELNELERPIAAEMLLERLRPASAGERAAMLAVVRDLGGIELMLRGTRRRRPWHRALSLRTLGWLGAEEGVQPALTHLADGNRHVRDASVRALGRIGDERALPALEQVYLDPDRDICSGFAYEAVVAFGPEAEHVLRRGLHSSDEHIRVSSCFGIAAVLEPERARPLLEPMLADRSPSVRAGAAETLGRLGGDRVPSELARACGDEQAGVRRAVAGALGAYDDPAALELLLRALADGDRLTAVRAGESIVRLSRRPNAGPAARRAIEAADAWPLGRARVLASVGAR